MNLSPNRPNLRSQPGTVPTKRRRCRPRPGGALAWLHSVPPEVTQECQGVETKEQFTCHTLALKLFLSLGNRAEGSEGHPTRPLSRLALSTSYINGMVAFVGDLFPAGRAGVRIFEGISEALAAEDMATLCRDNETSILHNLRVAVHADGTADSPRGP